jgi:putative ABC transport system ATP-binding protein
MMEAPTRIYDLRHLRKTRTGAQGSFELHVPHCAVRAGEVVAVCGASGCGKSTLLDMLAMILQPDGAERFLFTPNAQAEEVNGLWSRRDLDALARLRGRHIGYVLQAGGLLPFLSVSDNIALPSRLLGRPADGTMEQLADRLGIRHCLDRLPATLSVGERQRAAIARALAHRPSVVLADEPTASVDPLNADTIFALFAELVSDFGVTALVASHDWRRIEAAGFATLDHRLERNGPVTRSLFWN